MKLQSPQRQIARSRWAILSGLALISLILSGCAAPSGDPGSSPDQTRVRVGYISYDESVPYVHTISQGIQAAADKNGVDLLLCDSKGDAAKALECAIRFKQQNVDALINYQSDASAAAAICAQGPDVPVVAITIQQAPCQVSFMGADNLKAGTLAGEAIGKYFMENFDCKYDAFVALEIVKQGKSGLDRAGGYFAGFESVCGEIHDLREIDTQGSAEIARSMMVDTLTAIPEAKRIIVVTMNDSLTLASLAAASTSNRLDSMFVSGQGLDSSGVCGMRQYPSQWLGDTAYFPERYGEVVIPALVEHVNGTKSLPEILDTQLEFVTPDTVDEIYADVTC